MKIKQPESIFLEGGRRAAILLHSFTGSTRDMKALGQHLNSKGYTVHIPIFEGHGMGPDALVESSPKEWWRNVVESYDFLKGEGHSRIAVAGVSLGGILALKAASSLEGINGAAVMSTPQGKSIDDINRRVVSYTRNFMSYVGRTDEEIEERLNELEENPMASLPEFEALIKEVHNNLDEITVPLAVKYGGKDDGLYKESAEHIYGNIESEDKGIKSYPAAGHLMTKGRDKEELYDDILEFLENLTW